MKQWFLLLFLCPALSWAQYTPVLDTYNEWQVTACFFGCTTDTYYTDGDTLVDGKTYKILDGYHYISRKFLLREEVAQKKVYLNFVETTTADEKLLYDFSLEVGDSINMQNPISPFPSEAGYYQVDSIIPRPLVDGANYDHFYLSPTPSNTVGNTNAVWIEGVGSLSLLNAPGGEPNINGVGHLSCFFKNGELFYSNLDSIDACKPNIILDRKEVGNPMDKLILIQTEASTYELRNAQNVASLEIFSLQGRKLQQLNHQGAASLQCNLETLPNGLYILLATSNTYQQKPFKVLIP